MNLPSGYLTYWKIPELNGGFVRWENHLFQWATASGMFIPLMVFVML